MAAKFAGKYRFRLKVKNLERVLFLHHNLRPSLLSYPLLHELPKPPADFNLQNGPLRLASNYTAPQQDIDGSNADA